MDPFSFAPIAAILNAAYWVVESITDLLTPFTGAASAALAIVALTVIVRLALIPVGISQSKAEFTRRRLAPKLKELQAKYKKKPEVLQQKTLELYKKENASPFAGMLPLLAQAPIISIIYALFIRTTVDGHANALLTTPLLGVPLGAHVWATAWPGVLVFIALLAIMGVVAWFNRVIQRRLNPETPAWMTWLPFLSLVFALFVPLAAAIYLTVTTAWTLGERAVLRRKYWVEG